MSQLTSDAVARYYKRREERLKARHLNEDASQRLAFGLCKKYGIDLPKGATPQEAWDALKEKTGKSPADWYNDADAFNKEKEIAKNYGIETNNISKKKLAAKLKEYEDNWSSQFGIYKPEVNGPKGARKWLNNYILNNRKIKSEARKYRDVLIKVRNFIKDNPNADNFNTYSTSGVLQEINSGYCLTFHQNGSAQNPYEGWDDKTYSEMCAVAIEELGAKGVNIGYYGNPEVSFVCDNVEKACVFATIHNQDSIYNAANGDLIYNPFYNELDNPISNE